MLRRVRPEPGRSDPPPFNISGRCGRVNWRRRRMAALCA